MRKKIIIIGIVIAIIVAIIAIIISSDAIRNKFVSNYTESSNSEDISKAFFFKTGENQYKMYNIDGELMTQDTFKYVYDFHDGVALVVNSEYEYAIINESGKYIVEYGKYKRIEDLDGIFLARDSEQKKYLLNNEGKVIGNFDGFESADIYCKGIAILKNEEEKKYIIINKDGKKIVEFNIEDENVNIQNKKSLDEKNIYISYVDNRYLINTDKQDVIYEWKSNKNYDIKETNNKSDKVFLAASDAGLISEIILADKNGIIYKKDCNSRSIDFYDDCYVIIENDEGCTLIDDKGKEYNYTRMIEYIDPNSYCQNHLDDYNSTDIYLNGQVVKTIEGMIIRSEGKREDYYILSAIAGNNLGIKTSTIRLFDKNGERFNDYDYEDFIVSDNAIVVSFNGETRYIANNKGEPISQEYKALRNQTNYFIATKLDGKQAIVTLDGKELITGDKVNYSNSNDRYVEIIENDMHSLYDLQENKIIITSENNINIFEKYFYIIKDGVTEYYSYNSGKKFYEQ